MIDPFARAISYLRVSVTDRCDFRCVYCMAEDMTFLPKSDVLSLEELERLCTAFVRLGVRKLRLTGGEPLVRSPGEIQILLILESFYDQAQADAGNRLVPLAGKALQRAVDVVVDGDVEASFCRWHGSSSATERCYTSGTPVTRA